MIKRIIKKTFCLSSFELRLDLVASAKGGSTALLLLYFFSLSQTLFSQVPPSGDRGRTYCNPINIDYGYTPIPNFSEWGRHRATADPVIVLYKNDYYLFSTNQWGYWWSSDML
ncbi:MAG TPA: hypothetical protein VFH07_06860, partial [Chitinophagaceae bacterium]|nr:hypothetical protein [Chitinophagaceae bacterium]